MNVLRPVFAMAVADFRERTRRPGFLAAVGLVGWLAYAVATERIALRLDAYEGVMNAAWLGSLLALVVSTVLGWLGFYLINNALDLDRRTGVGALLAASPISRLEYLLAKWLSNCAVLGLLIGLLMIASLLLHWRHAQQIARDLPALLAPILVIGGPLAGLTAACAVLMESVRFLRGAVGNALWLFGFMLMEDASMHLATGRLAWVELLGMQPLMSSMARAAAAAFPGYRGGYRLTVMARDQPIAGFFHWPGIDWSAGTVMPRMLWLPVAAGLVLLAAACFDRFDPGRAAPVPQPRGSEPGEAPRDVSRLPLRAGDLPAALMRFSPAYRVGVELRLLLTGTGRLGMAVALGLAAAGLFVPPDARGMMLLAAWIWPLRVWSAMGCREAQEGTGELVQACTHPLLLQLPAQWVAGLLVAAVAGSGVLLRLLVSGDTGSLTTGLAAAAFIPSLALAAGVLTGGRKLFEVSYLLLCYAGPLNGVAALDFIGARSPGVAPVWLTASAACLSAAGLWRWRQLRG